jgi:hypothetical protein
MTDPVKEGWYADPADRHQYRWFSQGQPTDLVMDGGGTSRDTISMSDRALFQSMALEQPPDGGPLLRHPGQQESGPDPIIRPGIDPVGLRYTTRMARYGVYSWRFPMLGLGVAVLIEFWLGLNQLTVLFMLVFILLALVPLLWAGSALRSRLLERQVWLAAASHDASVLPLLARWRLIRPGEYFKGGFVLCEAAALAGLIVHQFRG